MTARFSLTIDIDVLEPDMVIRVARDYAQSCQVDPSEITSVSAALPWVIEAGVTPLDHGFEIADKRCHQVFRARQTQLDDLEPLPRSINEVRAELTVDQAKRIAKQLVADGKRKSIPITHMLVLESIAHLNGFRNWNQFVTWAREEEL